MYARPRPRGVGLLLFLFGWPGVIPDCFRNRRPAQLIDPVRFLAAWARMGLGAASVILLATFAPRISDRLLGLAGIAALLLAVHLGIGECAPLADTLGRLGVPLLFDRPWAATTLTEFWSRRWKLAFVEMNQRLFMRRLYRLSGKSGSRVAAFALSGVLHELALSLPGARALTPEPAPRPY